MQLLNCFSPSKLSKLTFAALSQLVSCNYSHQIKNRICLTSFSNIQKALHTRHNPTLGSRKAHPLSIALILDRVAGKLEPLTLLHLIQHQCTEAENSWKSTPKYLRKKRISVICFQQLKHLRIHHSIPVPRGFFFSVCLLLFLKDITLMLMFALKLAEMLCNSLILWRLAISV